MINIRLHGLGGQGIVTAAEILALAGWENKLWPQAMPAFGPERTGTPVMSFVRFDNKKIITREPITNPNWLIISEAKLLALPATLEGLAKNGCIILNSEIASSELQKKYNIKQKIFCINAKALALELGNPLVANSLLLGFFAKHSSLITLPALKTAIKDKLASKAKIIDINLRAVEIGYKN